MFLSVRLIFYTFIVKFSPAVKCYSNSNEDNLLPISNSKNVNLINAIKELIEVYKVEYTGAILFAIRGFNLEYQQLFSDILNDLMRDYDRNLALVKTAYSDDLPEDLVASWKLTVFFVDSFYSLKYFQNHLIHFFKVNLFSGN